MAACQGEEEKRWALAHTCMYAGGPQRQKKEAKKAAAGGGDDADAAAEVSAEEAAMADVMGFGSFNTSKK